MKIRTQFTLTVALFGATLIAIAASLLATKLQVDRLQEQEAIAHDVELGTRELSYLSNDYLLHRENQQRARWEAKFYSFSIGLSGLMPDDPEQMALANNIKANQQRLKTVFTEVASSLESMSPSGGAVTDLAFIRVSWSRMEVQNQAMAFDASRLARLMEEQVDRLKQKNILLMFILIALFAAFLVMNHATVRRRILKAISDLQDGAGVIGSGNLDFVIEEKQADEIGELTRAFNRMTADLKGVTASKAELEREITERKQAEETLRRRTLELQHLTESLELRVQERTGELELTNRALREYAGRLERLNQELQDFAFVASHDLQEPLRKIQTFGDRLKIGCGDTLGEQGGDFLDRMIKSANRMSQLLKSLLAYSLVAKQADELEPADLAAVVRDAVSDLELAIEKAAGRVEIGELPVIEADPIQMRRLFQNLIGNSLKYCKECEKPVVRVFARTVGETCQIHVEDNGMGFDEIYLDRIFRPFQRLHPKSAYEGTGMGLAICRKIVEHHLGSINARSTPGGGSTFIVTLPLKRAQRVDV